MNKSSLQSGAMALQNHETDPTTVANWQAQLASWQALLNCYCREVAGPGGQFCVGPLFGQHDWPMSVRMHLNHPNPDGSAPQAMQILLPQHQARLLVVVASLSLTGNFRYRSPVFYKAPNKAWALLEQAALANVLLSELAQQLDVPANTELLQQIADSVSVTSLILAQRDGVNPALPADPLPAYIASEQNLLYGHPFHPAPKSRQGFNAADLARYSPELGQPLQLHYFSVAQACIREQSLLPQSISTLLQAAQPGLSQPGRVALPVHPWQAAWLLQLPLVQQAMRAGQLQYLGPQGEDFFATSSIRTLFQPGNRYFYKFSLQVRITNCVRKNAWYELESALQVARILGAIQPELQQRFSGLVILSEPGFISVDLAQQEQSTQPERPEQPAHQQVLEGFGLILRDSLEQQLWPDCTPLLAGSLFGNREAGQSQLQQILQTIRTSGAESPDALCEQWFARYVALLLPPVLYCYFKHGIVFEPHLQNVVLGLQQGWPAQIFLRDFEGVKLLPGHHPATSLAQISERARQSLWYEPEQGWNRIIYCLLVNNCCEAINQLAPESPSLQSRLWGRVRHELLQYLAQHGCEQAQIRINALLGGQALPGKTNLLNRFLKRADRAAGYVPVSNPLAGCAPISGTTTPSVKSGTVAQAAGATACN